MNFDPSSSSQADAFRLSLFLTPPHPCDYLPDRSAATLFVDPQHKMSSEVYRLLLARGFRRSGSHVYRPHCPSCTACVPARIPLATFKPGRSFRRILEKNRDLQVSSQEPAFSDEQFELYRDYVNARHDDGPMVNPTREDFVRFLGNAWGGSQWAAFRHQGRLVMVTAMDHQKDSLSAVYTWFHPDYARRSLGTYAILWGVEEARRLGKGWLYLGYWIESCQKMRYKSRFRPLEIYRGQKWGILP